MCSHVSLPDIGSFSDSLGSPIDVVAALSSAIKVSKEIRGEICSKESAHQQDLRLWQAEQAPRLWGQRL